MENYIVITVFSFILSFILINFFSRIASKLNILLSRKKKIPLIGGVGLAVAFVFPYLRFTQFLKINLPPELIYILVSSFVILAIEVIDDWVDFPLKIKTVLQIFIISLFLFYGKKIQIYFLPFWANWILSFLWIMGITNAFNLLDISDGLCSGVSLITIITFLVISIINANILLISLFTVLLGAFLAFFILNIPPAKIYMGNAGSHFLGFLFASLSIYGDYATYKNPISVVIPILILALPIIDTTYLVIARLKKNLIPLKKSDDHIFLQLLLKGTSVWKALGMVYLLTVLWCITALLVVHGFNFIFLFFLISSFLVTIFMILKFIPPQK